MKTHIHGMKKVSSVLAIIGSFFFTTQLLFAAQIYFEPFGGSFPTSPDPTLTPGLLCEHASEIRYPEKIRYCKRNVDTSTKRGIIITYDRELGYEVGRMNRDDFKIDHYIPLCMGGANEIENLWPQHKSVYVMTDPLEQSLCEKMSKGQLKQAEAIEVIKRAKANPFDQYIFQYY